MGANTLYVSFVCVVKYNTKYLVGISGERVGLGVPSGGNVVQDPSVVETRAMRRMSFTKNTSCARKQVRRQRHAMSIV